MAKDEHIATALNRVVGFFEQKPEAGLDTDRTTSVLTDGLKCVVQQGEHSAVIDMGEVMGGDGAGPSPGFFGRAALISCIAIGLKMTAARAGIQLDKINVDVEMDWDNRGIFGIEDVSAGPIAIRVTIAVDSRAPEEAIQAILPTALRNDPWLRTFVDPQTIEPILKINMTSEA